MTATTAPSASVPECFTLSATVAAVLPPMMALTVGADGMRLLSRTQEYVLAPGWSGMFFPGGVQLMVLSGEATCRAGDIAVLAKLQAFFDADGATPPLTGVGASDVLQLECDAMAVLDEHRATERWFIETLLHAAPAGQALSARLRRLEDYSLVRFLLDEANDAQNLHALAARYGVSYTHFRRLCHRALGGPAKAELNNWRMARALLELAEGRADFTTVALSRGFASSSHFSHAVKGQVGVSPRGLTNIVNLVDK